MMKKILVWDTPNRIFHWAFAASLTAAIAIGFLADDEQSLFQWHMLFGIAALFLLCIRLVMGVAGSRYSRFSSYPVHPREVMGYMVSAVFSKTKLYAGNNPGSAIAALLMFTLVPALYISGMGYGGDTVEDLHETFAWALLTVVLLHLAGLAWHTLRHRENISLAMITGRKAGRPEDTIASAHRLWGLVILLVSIFWVTMLFVNHDESTGSVRLPGIGITLQLGDYESDHKTHQRDHHDHD